MRSVFRLGRSLCSSWGLDVLLLLYLGIKITKQFFSLGPKTFAAAVDGQVTHGAAIMQLIQSQAFIEILLFNALLLLLRFSCSGFNQCV